MTNRPVDFRIMQPKIKFRNQISHMRKFISTSFGSENLIIKNHPPELTNLFKEFDTMSWKSKLPLKSLKLKFLS